MYDKSFLKITRNQFPIPYIFRSIFFNRSPLNPSFSMVERSKALPSTSLALSLLEYSRTRELFSSARSTLDAPSSRAKPPPPVAPPPLPFSLSPLRPISSPSLPGFK